MFLYQHFFFYVTNNKHFLQKPKSFTLDYNLRYHCGCIWRIPLELLYPDALRLDSSFSRNARLLNVRRLFSQFWWENKLYMMLLRLSKATIGFPLFIIINKRTETKCILFLVMQFLFLPLLPLFSRSLYHSLSFSLTFGTRHSISALQSTHRKLVCGCFFPGHKFILNFSIAPVPRQNIISIDRSCNQNYYHSCEWNGAWKKNSTCLYL